MLARTQNSTDAYFLMSKLFSIRTGSHVAISWNYILYYALILLNVSSYIVVIIRCFNVNVDKILFPINIVYAGYCWYIQPV